jgi:hypothetical protein
MEKTFTPQHVKTNLVEFELSIVPEANLYRSNVTAPIDFVVEFKLVKGKLVKISNNHDFYDSLIYAVKTAIVQKIRA